MILKSKSLIGEFDTPADFKPLLPLNKCDDEVWIPLIEGVLDYKTLAILHGQKQSCKSWFAGQIAVCLATGTPFFNHKIPKPGAVVYVYAEGAMKRRLKALCAGMGVEVPNNIYPYSLRTDLSTPEAVMDLSHHIPEDTVLIILDNFEKYWSSNMEESIVSDAVRTLRNLSEYATVLLVQHQQKNASKGTNAHHRAIGSVRIINAADSTFALTRKSEMITCELYNRESEAEEEFSFVLKKTREGGLFLEPRSAPCDSAHKLEDQVSRAEEILRTRMKGQHSPTSIYETYLKNEKIIGTQGFYSKLFPALCAKNFLKSPSQGLYELNGAVLLEASGK